MRMIFCLLMFLTSATVAFGQETNLNVVTQAGQDITVPIGEIKNVTFVKNQTGAVFIEQLDGSLQQSELTKIDKITF